VRLSHRERAMNQVEDTMEHVIVMLMVNAFANSPQPLGIDEAIIPQNIHFGRNQKSVLRRVLGQILVAHQKRRKTLVQNDVGHACVKSARVIQQTHGRQVVAEMGRQ